MRANSDGKTQSLLTRDKRSADNELFSLWNIQQAVCLCINFLCSFTITLKYDLGKRLINTIN